MPRPAKKPRTRPRGPMNSLVTIWMLPEERERLRAAAEKAGEGLGPWLRSLGLREAQR